jgi:hypothetical protein
MMVEKNKSLILWPSLKTYGLEKGDVCKRIFNNNDFTIHVEFSVEKLENYDDEQITIFWKVPFIYSISINPSTYCNSDNQLIKSHLFFTNISTNIDNNEKILRNGKFFDFEFNKKYLFTVVNSIETMKIKYYINYDMIFEIETGDLIFNQDDNPQILLGNDKFGELKNYNVNFDYLILSNKILNKDDIENIKENYSSNLNKYGEYNKTQNYNLLGLYDFKEFTKFKVFDFSGNNNHINIEKNRT